MTKKSECFLKVLKGQGHHRWTEASSVTVQQLEIPGNSRCTNPLGNSSETPHRGTQPNSPRSLPLPGPTIAEQKPEAGHAQRKGASPIPPGKKQRPSLHAIAQHKSLGVAVVPVNKGQEKLEKL